MQTDTFEQIHNSTLSVAQQTNHKILQRMYSYTLKTALAHAVISLLIIFWLADVANLTELSIWFCVLSCMSCFRLFLYAGYTKFCDNSNHHLWFHAWAGCSALMGAIYAVGMVYFTPFSQAEYTAALGLFVVGLTLGSVMVYSVSMYAVLSFVMPITLITGYSLVAHGGNIGMMTALSTGFCSIAIMVLIRNISNAFKKSILVSLQHQHERDRRKLVEQQLQYITRRDGLTGVFNKRYFDETLETEIGRAHRNHQPLCVIMFDLDCFKEYNAQYGHVAGDNCLINVAEIAQGLASRKGDLVARYGGEEFAIILPNIDLAGAVAFATKLQHVVQNKRLPHVTSKLTSVKCVTISLGVTNLMPFTKAKPGDLILHAETALFEAKRQGRNRVHFTENNGANQSASL